MQDDTRSMEIEYVDPSLNEGYYDVSFEVTERAEELLFSAFEAEIGDDIVVGTVPSQKIHLFKRIAEQRRSHPPWIDTDTDVRTYDLVITEWDYHLLSRMIGSVMSNIHGPSVADDYKVLQDAWQSITDDMTDDDDGRDVDMVGQMTISDGSEFNVYEDSRSGARWYVCTECGTSYASVGDEHVCQYDDTEQ